MGFRWCLDWFQVGVRLSLDRDSIGLVEVLDGFKQGCKCRLGL